MAEHFHLARITIQLLSPLSVASGDGGWLDVALLRDANGLPMLSGAAIKGLLRELADSTTERLSGNADSAGRLLFSHGAVHDSKNVAVYQLRRPADIESDAILKNLRREAPLLRDHVKLTERGTAEETAKYDRTAVPRGTRFSFEIGLWGKVEEVNALKQVVQLAWHPLFRPGGATRRGYGRVGVVHATTQSFDCSKTDELTTLPQIRGDPWSTPLKGDEVEAPGSGDDVRELLLTLTARGLWRAGSEGEVAGLGTRRGRKESNPAREVDAAFTREPKIVWANGTASWHAPEPLGDQTATLWPNPPGHDDFVLQGSSIRGALAHRALFHWNRENDGLVDADNPPDAAALARLTRRRDGLIALFGDARDVSNSADQGQRSALIVEDVVFRPEQVTLAEHNSIDRFSGGVRNAVLFSEELVQTGALEFRLLIDASIKVPKDALAALAAALDDLVNGRLALGAKSSGRFEGDMSAIKVFCGGGAA